MKPVIAMTMGDPGGIGPEIILKSLKSIDLGKSVYVLIGAKEVFDFAAARFGLAPSFNYLSSSEAPQSQEKVIHFLDITAEAARLYQKQLGKERPTNEPFAIGRISDWNAALAFTALKTAADWGERGWLGGLITAPLQKNAMRLMDPKFTGHTDYLAERSHVSRYAMMFYHERFCVTLATIHLPLNQVSGSIKSDDLVHKMILTHDFLKHKLHIQQPKLAVCALNPHGNEFGPEEDEIIVPAVQQAQQKGLLVEGPLSGDQVFYDAYEGRFHGVIAMYHDQGLAPFKMIGFRDGVNVTLGLPYIRTSPDHGTAFDIAYQGSAFHSAFFNSIRLAEKVLN